MSAWAALAYCWAAIVPVFPVRADGRAAVTLSGGHVTGSGLTFVEDLVDRHTRGAWTGAAMPLVIACTAVIAVTLAAVVRVVSEYRTVHFPGVRREIVVALMQAAAQVSRTGMEPGQAVARPDASGAPGPDPEVAVRHCARAVRVADEAAQLVHRRLP
jgi:hypothetical protein